jgi:hypothetical protein
MVFGRSAGKKLAEDFGSRIGSCQCSSLPDYYTTPLGIEFTTNLVAFDEFNGRHFGESDRHRSLAAEM